MYTLTGERIVKIEYVADGEFTEEVWKMVTSEIESDWRGQVLRHVQICNPAVQTPQRYLQVTQEGTVDMKGKQTDLSTFFTIRISWSGPEEKAQIKCEGGPCANYVLYMENSQIKAKPWVQSDKDNPLTIFVLRWAPHERTLSVESWNKPGQYLIFDGHGNYIQQGNEADQMDDIEHHEYMYFRPYVVKAVSMQ